MADKKSKNFRPIKNYPKFWSFKKTNLIACSVARISIHFESRRRVSPSASVRSIISLRVPDAEISWVASSFSTVRKILDQASIGVAFDRPDNLLVDGAAHEPVGKGTRLVEKNLSLFSDLSFVGQSLAFNSTTEQKGRIG